MRVITGLSRGMRLESPEGEGVRPTSEMAKEAMFSILQNEIPGSRVLDLFSGSGQLGIEALSRGALSCVFVDNSRESQRLTLENVKKTGLSENARVVLSDSVTFLKSCGDVFDIALLDPPYQKGLIEAVLPLVAGLMSKNGVILCETANREELPEMAGEFKKAKEYRYGKTRLTTYRFFDE